MSRPPSHHGSYYSNLAPAPSTSPFPGHLNASSSLLPPHPRVNTSVSPFDGRQSRTEPPPLSKTAGPMPGSLERPIVGPRKRLILTCDGTWLDADNGLKNGHRQPPSNVSRIGWAIKDTSRDGIPQIVNYQAGVGTSGGIVARVVGGATGAGIKENVREAYTYIATNWRQGDEVFLIGFSRGAFTVRTIGSLINELGLLTRRGLPYFSEIFEDLEHRSDDRYVSKFPDHPFPQKGPFDDRYVAELRRLGLTRTGVPIKAVCCWDTVGSLGIPRTPWMEMMNMAPRDLKAYQFNDTRVPGCVENAFQALALDEHRAPFSPALWEMRDGEQTNLKQVWFPGVHSNIGGGYDDQEIANITLAWMMSRLEQFLDFRNDFLRTQFEENREYYRTSNQRPRWWSSGEIYRSLKGVYTLTGSKTRTPGSYTRTDPRTGRSMGKKLKNTNEYIHASVRTRVGMGGPGLQDRGTYNPPALRDWTFDAERSGIPGQGGNMGDGSMVVWNYRGDREITGQTRIPEAVLLETEMLLLKQFQAVSEYIRTMRPPVPERDRKRRSRRDRAGHGADDHMMAGGLGPDTGTGLGTDLGEKRRSSRVYDNEYDGPIGGVSDVEAGGGGGGRRRRRRRAASTDGRDPDRDDRYRDRSRKRNSTRY